MAASGHELKTPTAAIHNYLQLVERRLDSGQPDEAAKYNARAMVQAKRLDELVERLFDVSRIQSGRLEIVSEPDDLVAVVRDAADVSAVLPDAPTIKFSAKPASLIVPGDDGRLAQVFLNLLANAIEHAGGSGAIEVMVRPAGGFAQVQVRDHGRGIEPEDLAILFEAYSRVGGRKRNRGLGLGLFVAREIVTAHQGTITVTSRIGEGTTFTVRLPIASATPRAASAKPRVASAKPRAPSAKPRAGASKARSS